MVHGLSSDSGGRGGDEDLRWEEKDPREHSPVSTASARMRWAPCGLLPGSWGWAKMLGKMGLMAAKVRGTGRALLPTL